jgi:hypothetical protein
MYVLYTVQCSACRDYTKTHIYKQRVGGAQ